MCFLCLFLSHRDATLLSGPSATALTRCTKQLKQPESSNLVYFSKHRPEEYIRNIDSPWWFANIFPKKVKRDEIDCVAYAKACIVIHCSVSVVLRIYFI